MSVPERTRQPGALAIPEGARQLGARVKPIIRLGMGIKVEGQRQDGSTYTRPDKTDYFTVRGDERAVAKFKTVYGDKPKSVKIMVPSELSLALDISYRSFIGGQSEDGGRPLALGMTNFAPLGYVGGPDVLRVWRQDGTFAEVETAGLDELGKPLDDAAADLGIAVYTTFTFTIPEVLGWGSFAQVTSKGKKSADNLTFKLTEIYSAFGSQAPWAFDRDEPPRLVIKPDTALTRFEDKQKGEAKWGKTAIFVLDVVIPEAFDDMRDRLSARQQEIAAAGGSTAMVYGPERETRALPSGEHPDVDASAAPSAEEPVQQPAQGDAGAAAASTAASTGEDGPAEPGAAAPAPDEEPDEPTFEPADQAQAEGAFAPPDERAQTIARNAAEAGLVRFTKGIHKGMTIAQVHEELTAVGKDGAAQGESYIRYCVRRWKGEPEKSALAAYCQHHWPDALAEGQAA